MARTIQKVMVAGARGNVGAPIVKHLLERGFQVTALTRKDSQTTSSMPLGVKVQAVDFNDGAALTQAMTGQDAFVDATLAQDDTPQRFMDAAAAAQVYRYIPSDFSLDPLNAAANALPVFSKRAERDGYLYEKCKSSGSRMTWSIVANGAYLDWNLHTGFMGLDLYNRSASLMDGGDNRVVWTTLDSVGQAVAGIMQHPEETENQPIYVSSVVKSCSEMLRHIQEALESGQGSWTVTEISGEAENQKALNQLFSGKSDMQTIGTLIRFANARSETSGPWPRSDNNLLGIPSMTDSDLEALIKEIAQRPAPTWG